MSEESEVFDLKELEKEISQLSDRSFLSELLKAQLTEYEMLQAIFSSPGEFSMDDYSALADIDDYLNGRTSETPPHLVYKIHLNIETHKLEVCVDLPLEYPNLEPDVFLRSEDLTRTQQRALNNDLADYICGLDRGEVCIFSTVSWVQENALEYFSKKPEEFQRKKEVKKESSCSSFSCYWIYSHHIYSKTKRKEILELAGEYDVTGFCLPGRPGIICLEGYSSDCEECWQKIKSMNWKKIICKKTEETKLESEKIEELRRFSDFKEISFESKGGRRNDFHMDFGEFLKFLRSHDCEYVFKDYFGIDGK